MTSRIYIACLASYNNGRLHGEWIDATSDADDMGEQVARILRASPYPNVMVKCPDCEGKGTDGDDAEAYLCDLCKGKGSLPSAEEWAVHDYDDETGLLSDLGETSDLKAIARLVETAELAERELGEEGPAIFAAYADHVGVSYISKEEPSDAVQACRDAYAGSGYTFKDWAESYVEETGMLDQIPEQLRYYFDCEAWARDQEVWHTRFGGSCHVFWNH